MKDWNGMAPWTTTSMSEESSVTTAEIGELIEIGPNWGHEVIKAALNGAFTAVFLGILWVLVR